MRHQEDDGGARYAKRRGAYWGTDKNGNAILDLTRAHTGSYLFGERTEGHEPEPDLSGTSGNVRVRLPENSTLTVELTKGVQVGNGADADALTTRFRVENNKITILNEGGAGLIIEGKDGDAALTLGDGAVHAAIVEHLQSLYEDLKDKLDDFDAAYSPHTHISAAPGSASGPASAGGALPIGAPAWDPGINSGKVSMPDG
jgi:hypothetical protein